MGFASLESKEAMIFIKCSELKKGRLLPQVLTMESSSSQNAREKPPFSSAGASTHLFHP